MLIIKVFLVFILYFTATESEFIQQFDNNIKNHVMINSIQSDQMLEVTIKTDEGEEKSLILPRVKKLEFNSTNVLYTALSCSIGYSTMSSIYDFIKWSPLFYQHKFLDFNNLIYTEEFRPTFEKYFNEYVLNISENVDRFINVLYNILQTKSNSSYYRDTSILEALVSLQIKTFYITSDTKHPADTRLQHYDILQLVLEETMEIQRSLSINCNAIDPDHKNPQFYDLYIEMSDIKRREIINFFDICAENLALEIYSEEKCTPTQKLLEDFITFPPSDNFSIDIAGTSIAIKSNTLETDRVLTTIEDIYSRMKISYDSELIFLYQDSIIAATMKIIFREILKGLKTYDKLLYMAIISDQINDIYSIYDTDNVSNYPQYFIDGFTILHRFKANDPNINESVLQHFYDESLGHVVFTSEAEEIEGLTYIDKILTKVIERSNSFKCFQSFYKPLRDKYNKHYIPFNSHKKALLLDSAVKNVEHFKRVCDFAINVYSSCFLAIMFLHDIDDPFYNDVAGNEKFDNRLYNVLTTIQHYFLLIIKKGTDDEGILKMAYNIAPILINTLRKSKDEIKVEIKVVLHKVMAELNSVGVQYCASPKNNFLLFNQMNFYDLGNKRLVDKSMIKFYRHCVKNVDENDLNESSIDPTEFNYLSVDYVYTNFIKDSVVMKDYGKTIKFYWHGQIKSIQDIYQNTDLFLIKSHDVYALYDMYFKFYIVALYYEIKEILLSKSITKIKKNFLRIRQTCKLEYTSFPQGLHMFISDIKKLLKYPVDDKQKFKSQLKELELKIDIQLLKFNIVLFKKKKLCEIFVKNSCFSFYSSLSSLKIELSENVPFLNEKLLKNNH